MKKFDFVKNLILKILQKTRRKRLTKKTIFKKLKNLSKDLKNFSKKDLEIILNEMVNEGFLLKTPSGSYELNEKTIYLKGRIDRKSGGFGFLLRDEGKDVFIPPGKMKGAKTGDKVVVRITNWKGERPIGEVIKIVQKSPILYIGILKRENKNYAVLTNQAGLPPVLKIKKNLSEKKLSENKIVLFEPVFLKYDKTFAKILYIFGDKDNPQYDHEVIIKKYGFPEEFPLSVEREVKKLKMDKNYDSRIDLRDEVIYTIDPETAKDFDDAISVEKDGDFYKVGVHIADVSYFVRENSAIDKEARKRGFSVYLIDRVIPMLPERLSADLCSLKPGEDRLTFSVFIWLDKKGNIQEVDFKKSVIRSKARLTYEDAQRILYGDKPVSKNTILNIDYEILRKNLLLASEVAQILREKRYKEEGFLDFEFPEPEIMLSPKGNVKEILMKRSLWTNKIIEEFMILANRVVAEYFSQLNIPTIYRVHEEPDKKKLKEFIYFSSKIFGIECEGYTQFDLQTIIKEAEKREEGNLIKYLLLRSLMRAKYSVENVGHFGLGIKNYLHFTSPIRRYPDLVVHRLLWSALNKKRVFKDIGLLEKISEECSFKEEIIDKAEQDLLKIKTLRYLKGKTGEIFEGIITHVDETRLVIELSDFMVEGEVYLQNIGGRWKFIESDYKVVEKYTGKSFQIGQKLKVEIIEVEPVLMKLVLGLV